MQARAVEGRKGLAGRKMSSHVLDEGTEGERASVAEREGVVEQNERVARRASCRWGAVSGKSSFSLDRGRSKITNRPFALAKAKASWRRESRGMKSETARAARVYIRLAKKTTRARKLSGARARSKGGEQRV